MGAYASHRYLKSLDDAKAHIRYIGFREREDRSESLGLFSRESDSADAEEFIEGLKDKRLSHPDVPNVHTVLFSMSGDEWNRSGFEPGDYQNMIRDVMRKWELDKGYRLDWIAAEHRNPDHPHAHVVIKGSYKDRDGIEKRLRITNEDRKYFRNQFQETKELTRPFDPPSREYTKGHDHAPEQKKNITPNDFIKHFFNQVNREMIEEEFKREQEKRQSLKRKKKLAHDLNRDLDNERSR